MICCYCYRLPINLFVKLNKLNSFEIIRQFKWDAKYKYLNFLLFLRLHCNNNPNRRIVKSKLEKVEPVSSLNVALGCVFIYSDILFSIDFWLIRFYKNRCKCEREHNSKMGIHWILNNIRCSCSINCHKDIYLKWTTFLKRALQYDSKIKI